MIKFVIIEGIEGYNQSKEFRQKILADEMNFAEEKDEFDDKAFHIVGREEGVVICSARLYNVKDYIFTIDKICVNKADRMQYVGDTMIRALEDKAVSNIAAFIDSKVSENAWEFFEHEDYVQKGDEFTENGVKYKIMRRDLSKVRGCRGGCHK